MTTPSPSATDYLPRPIPADVLAELRHVDDAARRMDPYLAGESGMPIESVGSPLGCCLRPIHPGERVALVAYAPLRRWAAATGAHPGAYDEVGPVFIHADPCAGPAPADGYPFTHAGALRAVRRYDARGHIVGGRVVALPGDPDAALGHAIEDAFREPNVVLVHVRAVEYGCFQFEVRRPVGHVARARVPDAAP